MQARAERTRARILDAAASVFGDKGFDGASLNDVIRASDVTKGAFYFHFKSKEEVALAAFRFKQEQLVSRLFADAGQQPDALKQLRALLRARARLLAEDPAFRCFLRLALDLEVKAEPGSVFAGFLELSIGRFVELVKRGQAEGVIDAGLNPRVAGEGIFSAMIGADEVSRLLSGGKDLVRRTEGLLDLLEAGLRSRSRKTNR